MLVEGIDVSGLLNAQARFNEFRIDMNTYRDKAGAVQAFEFTYELAWKTMKRILKAKGLIAIAPRDCFREAAALGMIDDPEGWFKFIDVRNITVHTYDIETLNKVLLAFDDFSKAVDKFVNYLKDNS